MENALQRVSDLLGCRAAERLGACFARVAAMPGADRLFRRIASAAGVEDLRDYLAEVRYALVFAGLGFEVSIEPHGKKGPDLGIARGEDLTVVEVKRFRTVYEGPSAVSPDSVPEILPLYGDPQRDIRKAREKIQDKLRQLQSEAGIIALWNDDGDLEELEAREAIAELIADAAHGVLALPSGLQFVLYGSEFWNARWQQQFYLFPMRLSGEEREEPWQAVLEASTADELIRRAVTGGSDGSAGNGDSERRL